MKSEKDQQRNLLIVSTSTVHGKPYLTYLTPEIKKHFEGIETLVFVPFARPSGITWDAYTQVARTYFETIGIQVKGLHEFDDMVEGINTAEAIFTGGGNTFVLLNEIYENGLMEGLRVRLANGLPYMGTSAGSNLLGMTINNTNDMPIVYPPTFDAIGAVPFNINPHYLDPIPNSKHMGETRETRINEYHIYNKLSVIGLREGSFLKVTGNQVTLGGDLSARIFEKGKGAFEVEAGSDVSFLISKE
jgi:dipeptidase E